MLGNDFVLPKGRVDFITARKKSPIHISRYARLGVVGTTPILYGTHLTTDLDAAT